MGLKVKQLVRWSDDVLMLHCLEDITAERLRRFLDKYVAVGGTPTWTEQPIIDMIKILNDNDAFSCMTFNAHSEFKRFFDIVETNTYTCPKCGKLTEYYINPMDGAFCEDCGQEPTRQVRIS